MTDSKLVFALFNLNSRKNLQKMLLDILMVSVSHFPISSFSLVIHSVRMSCLRLAIIVAMLKFVNFSEDQQIKCDLMSLSHSPLSAKAAKSCSCLERLVSIFLPKATFSFCFRC